MGLPFRHVLLLWVSWTIKVKLIMTVLIHTSRARLFLRRWNNVSILRYIVSIQWFHLTRSDNSDGPGAFDFVQGDNSSNTQYVIIRPNVDSSLSPCRNPFWEIVKNIVTPLPPKEQVDCQFPKPVLLNTVSNHTSINVRILTILVCRVTPISPMNGLRARLTSKCFVLGIW